jgi:hypothetical protein
VFRQETKTIQELTATTTAARTLICCFRILDDRDSDSIARSHWLI